MIAMVVDGSLHIVSDLATASKCVNSAEPDLSSFGLSVLAQKLFLKKGGRDITRAAIGEISGCHPYPTD